MELRWSRNLGALTEHECNSLRVKTVLIVGCGGLGGYLAEYLARLGVGEIRVADGDQFEASNLNRQLLSLPSLFGKNKAHAAKDRIAQIDSSIRCIAYSVNITDENAETIISGCDLVLDAVDNTDTRILLSDKCTEMNLPLVHGAISGWTAQAAVSAPGDNLIRRLYSSHMAPDVPASLSFTPAMCAAMQAALCTKLLVGKPVKTGTLYLFDLLEMEEREIQVI